MLDVDEDTSNPSGFQQQDQDAVIETVHLYVVREEVQQPSRLPIALSALMLSFLIAICTLSPNRQPQTQTTIRVVAVFPPVQVYTAVAPISATGLKTFQAKTAHGTLTLTNGSVVSQELPTGLVFVTSSGVEVITASSVFVPAGSANGYGFATVSARAVTGGIQGNIPALAINSVYGTSLYIRNLTAFTGGKDSYSVKIETAQDRQTAISAARATLATQAIHLTTYLVRPCSELAKEQDKNIFVVWQCQYMAFHVPEYMHVTGFKLAGKYVYVDVTYVARPGIIYFK